MARMLSELVDTAPGFRAAVNLALELNDFEKAAAFLPTKQAAEVIFDMGRQTEPKANERARMLTGTYGTGKSHLGLVLAALYRGLQGDVLPVIGRLRERHPGRAKQFEEELAAITRDCPFLLVVVEGDQDSFDAALLRGLRSALDAAGLGDYMPSTYFSAAAERLRELMATDGAAERVEEAAAELGYRSSEPLLSGLSGGDVAALVQFEELHRRVCFNAAFLPEARMQAAETYRQAAEELVRRGVCRGIVVIWDEFGSFMERILRDPSAVGPSVQRFAEACQDSGTNQMHLYLIAHRTLESYVRRAQDTMHLPQSLREAWAQDFKKVVGRFREFFMESEPEELFDLVDQVLIQRVHDGWEEFVRAHDSDFTVLTDEAYAAGLFPDLPSSKLRSIVVEGSYPVHPMTAAFLPRVSEIVAQNQRTLFTFLCGDHPGTVADFLRHTEVPAPGERMPLVPADALWDYFEQAIREDQVGRQAYGLYRNGIASAEIAANDELGRRLLRALGLFELVRRADPERASELSANERNLALALDLRLDEDRDELRERLAVLSRRGAGQVVVRTRDGTYRFISGGVTDLQQTIEETIEQRALSPAAVARFLRERWGSSGKAAGGCRMGFEEAVEALRDNSDVISRTVEVIPVLAEETDNLGAWLADIGGGDFRDGYLFLALPTDDVQSGAVSKAALSYADNAQVIVARPASPLRGLREAVARIDALEAVAEDQANLWGEEGERHEEWQVEYDEAEEQLREVLAPVGLAKHASELNVVCIWRGDLRQVRSWPELEQLADEAMDTAFAKTPRTRERDIMHPPSKRDGLVGARRAVLGKLLELNAADLLLKETDQAQARLARLLQSFGVLRTRPRRGIGRPEAEQDAGAAEAWDAIVEFREQVRGGPRPLRELADRLRAAPFGIGQRVLPLLFAAALREDIRTGNLVLEREGRAGNWQTLQMDAASLDEAFADPSAHRVRYVDVTEQQFLAIEGLLLAAGGDAVPAARAQLLEQARTEITRWWAHLAPYCQQTAGLGERAKLLRDEVVRPLVHPDANAHQILVEDLRRLMEPPEEWGRDEFAATFGELVREIEGALDGLRERVARELLEALELQAEATSEGVPGAIRAWYEALPEATQQYCHPGDAGKLQRCLREPGEDFLGKLCADVNGRSLRDWSDRDVGHFVGRMLSAKEDLEKWTGPPGPPGPPGPVPAPRPGTASISVSGDVGGEHVFVQRQFRTIPREEFSEAATVILRLLGANLLEDYSMRDGERENIVLELVRRVFGNG